MALGRLTRKRPAAPMSDINVTPMVDVMLVLLDLHGHCTLVGASFAS